MVFSEIFKALGDVTRLRILNLISEHELCVCQIAESLRISQPNVSKQLNRLRYTGIINCRKISQWCFYSITETFKTKYKVIFEFIMEQFKTEKMFTEDLYKLEYQLKTNDCCQNLLQRNQ